MGFTPPPSLSGPTTKKKLFLCASSVILRKKYEYGQVGFCFSLQLILIFLYFNFKFRSIIPLEVPGGAVAGIEVAGVNNIFKQGKIQNFGNLYFYFCFFFKVQKVKYLPRL